MRYIQLLILGLFPLHAEAAGVGLRPVDWQTNTDNHLVTVQVVDDLTHGDLDRVRAAMVKARDGHKMVVALELSSPGGDGDTGLALAEYVSKNNIDVILTTRCWSACSFAAMVALGKGNLMIRPGAELGVHQVYDTGSGIPDKPWTVRAAKVLKKYGAPAKPLDDMVATAPSGLTVYDYDALVRMGALVIRGEWAWWIWE